MEDFIILSKRRADLLLAMRECHSGINIRFPFIHAKLKSEYDALGKLLLAAEILEQQNQ